jgi:hypothetical protein
MKNERILDVLVTDGILFELVEKQETIFAGKLGYATNFDEEPDIGQLLDEYRKIMSKITDAVEPEWWIGITINYGKKGAYKGYMFATEVATDNQDEVVDMYKVPTSHYLRIRKDDKNVLKILGKDSCQTFELFPLIYDVMNKLGYKYADNGAQEIECDYSKDMSIAYAYVAIDRTL